MCKKLSHNYDTFFAFYKKVKMKDTDFKGMVN